MSCDASTPSVAVIQSAYEREASKWKQAPRQRIESARSELRAEYDGRFLCQVTFLSNDDPSQRLYFDVVAVARTDKGWELRSGLCKR